MGEQGGAKHHMTISRKLLVLAVPAVLAAIAVPVAVAQAHAMPMRTTKAPAVQAASASTTAPVFHAAAAITKAPAVKAAITAETPDPAETASEPAGTGGHTDEAPGSTVESNTDHQFDGQE